MKLALLLALLLAPASPPKDDKPAPPPRAPICDDATDATDVCDGDAAALQSICCSTCRTFASAFTCVFVYHCSTSC